MFQGQFILPIYICTIFTSIPTSLTSLFMDFLAGPVLMSLPTSSSNWAQHGIAWIHISVVGTVPEQTEFLFNLKIKWKYIEGVSCESYTEYFYLTSGCVVNREELIHEICLSKDGVVN